MKIAFCLFRYFPYGGLQRDFLRIAQTCAGRGHEIQVFTLAWEGDRPSGMGINLVAVKGMSNHRRYDRYMEWLAHTFAMDRPDVVVGFNRMPGLDVYYAADTCYESRTRKYRPWWYRLLPRYRSFAAAERAVFQEDAATRILLVSSQQKPEFQGCYSTPDHRFHILPPGISRDRVRPENADELRSAFRAEQGFGEDDFLLLMVGSGFKTKGVDRAIQALHHLPAQIRRRTSLFIVGADDSRPFERMAARLGVASQVRFMGGRTDVPRFLLGADLLVHPAYNENTGTVLLEAMASGLPVLVTDVCGYAHFVEEADAGMLVPTPVTQASINGLLQEMMVSNRKIQWRNNGVAFAREADIYSLPERAADIIERVGQAR